MIIFVQLEINLISEDMIVVEQFNLFLTTYILWKHHDILRNIS